jgi:hypothetical protein
MYWTWVLALCTAALAIVAAMQAGLFLWQLRIMREGLRDSKLAAEAAQISAESTKRIERPWVLMDAFMLKGRPFDKHNREPTDSLATVEPDPPLVKFAWKNVGRSPAFLIGLKEKLFLIDDADSVASHWNIEVEVLDYDRAIIPDATYAKPVYLDIGTINPTTWTSILRGKSHLIFAAVIRYRDPFGEEHQTAFCARFSGLPKRPHWYQDYGGKEYNHQT